MMNYLWFYLILGYITIWATMSLIDKKRGKPIHDPSLYQRFNRRDIAARHYLPLLAMILVSIFVPLTTGMQLLIGALVGTLGVLMNIIAIASFSESGDGLNTRGIYRFSRNPMYVGGFMFLLGLNLASFRLRVLSIIFAALTLVWAFATHWTVSQEEAFLLEKSGTTYDDFRTKVPRYL
jgi:protein-S-isoprenylcysteine O-methyltransferase Ste14